MKKLLLMSILFGTVGIPVIAGKDANAHRGLRKVLLYSMLFYTAYWLALMFVIPRFEVE